jgi:Ni,Fe-hydrogenase I small subunit
MKPGCEAPVVRCNVPIPGWASSIGGPTNVGGAGIACTMSAFPDNGLPFMDEMPTALITAPRRACART